MKIPKLPLLVRISTLLVKRKWPDPPQQMPLIWKRFHVITSSGKLIQGQLALAGIVALVQFPTAISVTLIMTWATAGFHEWLFDYWGSLDMICRPVLFIKGHWWWLYIVEYYIQEEYDE